MMQEEVSPPEAKPREEALRRKRQVAAVHRRRRQRLVLTLAALCVVILVIVIVSTATGGSGPVAADTLSSTAVRSESTPVLLTGESHPAFTRLGDRPLLLPVAATDATIIAYQPVSDERAIALTPIGDKINTNAFVRFFRGIFSGEASIRYYELEGADGQPTTSVLVGAAPGSAIISPITGVVTRVEEYYLFGRYEDVRIDIRPEKMGGVTVSLMFVESPAVSIGDHVTAGKTQLGQVRQCPEDVGDTLSAYTYDCGSHVILRATGELPD